MLNISTSAPSALPLAPYSSSADQATSASKTYDPSYCLSEHLDYFSESVADLLTGDFDVIFSGSEAQQENDYPSTETANGYIQYSRKAKNGSSSPEQSFTLPSMQDVTSTSASQMLLPTQMPPLPAILAPKPMIVPNPIASLTKNCHGNVSSASSTVPVPITPYMVSPVSSSATKSTITSSLLFERSCAPLGLVSASNSDDDDASTAREDSVSGSTASSADAKKARKRQNNAPASSSSSSEASAVKAANPSKGKRKLDKSEREDIRRERNRQHAKRSRQRKREFTNELEQSVQALKAENEELFRMLGVAKETVMDREEEMQATATEHFVAALKCPENRILDDDALSALRGLFN